MGKNSSSSNNIATMEAKPTFIKSIADLDLDAVEIHRYKRIFDKYASIGKNGERFMTLDDFVSSIAPSNEFYKIKKSQYGILYRVADQHRRNLLDFNDFVVFENLLSKPDADYEIAFRLFDITKTGKITLDEFKTIVSSSFQANSVPFDFNCQWIKDYFGSHKDGIGLEEFSQLLKGFQQERLKQEFHFYDKNNTGSVSPTDFVNIMIHLNKHKLSDELIAELSKLAELYPDGNKISYSNTQAFFNLMRQMDTVERVVKRAVADTKDGKIGKSEFISTATKLLRFNSFTPMEVDILFFFASGAKKTDDRLTLDSFAKLFDPKYHWKEAEHEGLIHETKKTNAIHEVLKNIYNFALGSISGAVGATVVYPIGKKKYVLFIFKFHFQKSMFSLIFFFFFLCFFFFEKVI